MLYHPADRVPRSESPLAPRLESPQLNWVVGWRHDSVASLAILHRSPVPQLPLVVWLAAAGVVLALLGSCVVTAYVVLRAAGRRRVAQWPLQRALGLVGVALLLWLVVWLA